MAKRRPPSSRRIANQAARTKLLHKVIGDDARVLLLRYREVDMENLSRVLARAHSTSVAEVQTALMSDPRFELAGASMTIAGSRRTPEQAPQGGKPRPPATFTDDVRFILSEADTDRLVVTAASGESTRTLRCDFVRGDRGDEIWIAWAAGDDEEWQAAAQAGAWALGIDWKLPLVPATEALVGHPPVLVHRERSTGDAAQRVQAVLTTVWGRSDQHARLEKVACTPAELERRVLGEQTVRRLVRRATSRGAALRTCERCGQPLSDPASVSVGIGPECRKYYSAEVLRAVKTRSTKLPKPSAQKPTAWVHALREWLAA